MSKDPSVRARPTAGQPPHTGAEPPHRAQDAVGKEQHDAHEEGAEEEEPEVRIARGQPALDPVHAERPDERHYNYIDSNYGFHSSRRPWFSPRQRFRYRL